MERALSGIKLACPDVVLTDAQQTAFLKLWELMPTYALAYSTDSDDTAVCAVARELHGFRNVLDYLNRECSIIAEGEGNRPEYKTGCALFARLLRME